MSSLTGSSISGTYNQLLALPSSGGGGPSGGLKPLTDGNGATTFALQISADGIKSTGTLEVTGATTLNGAVVAMAPFKIKSSAGTGSDSALYFRSDDSTDQWRIYIDENVSNKLVFFDDTTDTVRTQITLAGTMTHYGALYVGGNTAGKDVKFFGETTNGAYMLWDADEDRLELDIGTADGAALKINTTNNRDKDIIWDEGGSTKGRIRFHNNTSGTDDLDRLELGTASDLDAIVIKGGAVGLGGVPVLSGGTAADSYALDIQGNSALSGTSHTGYAARLLNDGDNANRGGIRIVCGADNGAGETIYLLACDGDGNEIGSLRHNAVGTDFTIVATSDERLKENIADTAIAGLNTINALKVRDFDWKRSGESVKGGFVAQEVKTVMPEAVSGTDGATYTKIAERPSEDGTFATSTEIDPMGVSQTRMIPTLVKAVQELSAKVTALENA